MVKNTSKILLSILASLVAISPAGATSIDKTISEGFEVNLKEVLTVTVDLDHTYNTGNVFNSTQQSLGEAFLKEIATVRFTTNNALGYSATMTTKAVENPANGEVETSLKLDGATAITIPTLDESVTSEESFPANYWGFSLNGSNATTAVYNPLQPSNSAKPSVVAYANAPTDELRTIYFGTKGNADTVAGTYRNTVVISITAPPEYQPEDIPDHDDPVTPTPTNNTPSRAPARTIADTTDTEEPSASDAHEEPQGVVEDTTETHVANSNSSMSLAAGATVTAAAGLIFFILAKRKEDEDEETK